MSTIFSKKESTLFENSAIYFGVNSLRSEIADAIKRRMVELGDLNPSQVAKRSHDKITPAGVRNILRAESGVMVETLVIVAEALETTAPKLLIEALNPKTSNSPNELRTLLTFYFDHVPEECQLDMVASAQGIYQRRNKDKKIFERSVARAATREALSTEAAQHLAAERKEEEQQPEVAATTPPQSPPQIDRVAGRLNLDERADKPPLGREGETPIWSPHPKSKAS